MQRQFFKHKKSLQTALISSLLLSLPVLVIENDPKLLVAIFGSGGTAFSAAYAIAVLFLFLPLVLLIGGFSAFRLGFLSQDKKDMLFGR